MNGNIYLLPLRPGERLGFYFPLYQTWSGCRNQANTTFAKRSRVITPGRGCINFFVLCPVFWCTEKDETSSLGDSYSKCTISLSWENITHTHIEGHSAKDLTSSLGRCHGCERQRPRSCHRLAEANKAWELNAVWDPGLDPAWEKEH